MNKKHWSICKKCQGQGRVMQGPSKRLRRKYQRDVKNFELNDAVMAIPVEPRSQLDICQECIGAGLEKSEKKIDINNDYPTIAIIGGGIGGMALAAACLHRGIPFTLYERDISFDERSQGYGLTLQQASKAIAGLGIESLKNGLISTRHVVHKTDGQIIGEWGLRKWLGKSENETGKRKNIHIARQSLRQELLWKQDNLGSIKWNHKFINYSKNKDGGFNIEFEVGEKKKVQSADLIVGADGIRSSIRRTLIQNDSPLNYLGCIVMLGICSLEQLDIQNDLLDSATVFQTVDGHSRMYMMPYDKGSIMWQFSFPMDEDDAINLNKKGPAAMKDKILEKVEGWHRPIPEIIAATSKSDITGYPVYDREILNQELLQSAGNVTLIGDAAHPMSPFKGQGANQAILDALALVRSISINCGPHSDWRKVSLRKLVLNDFEKQMINRTRSKVAGSRIAAKVLHSKSVLRKDNSPRGKEI